MFSCEFCEISKKTFFTEHFWAFASHLIYQMIQLNGKRDQDPAVVQMRLNIIIRLIFFHKQSLSKQKQRQNLIWMPKNLLKHETEVKVKAHLKMS